MSRHQHTPTTKELAMKSYVFKVVIEQDKWPDEPDEKAIWRAYVPGLTIEKGSYGATYVRKYL